MGVSLLVFKIVHTAGLFDIISFKIVHTAGLFFGYLN